MGRRPDLPLLRAGDKHVGSVGTYPLCHTPPRRGGETPSDRLAKKDDAPVDAGEGQLPLGGLAPIGGVAGAIPNPPDDVDLGLDDVHALVSDGAPCCRQGSPEPTCSDLLGKPGPCTLGVQMHVVQRGVAGERVGVSMGALLSRGHEPVVLVLVLSLRT